MAINVFVFPVPTGMNRYLVTWWMLDLCVPRAHGDEPQPKALSLSESTCSPCPRG